ncbi:5961_t:CDS:2 [Diversispora eburnea]|uniref:5961_t:CDS:1 n=1 Tax=Diversispora eburnea TaxID=1213867 RepID=A0A9N9ASD1_9GLOM|nr:5961_t:CDS:2 [Diversispora eburnea]
MGQTQDKFVDEQNEDGSQDSSTVENSVITEAFNVASESIVHHDNGFLSPSIKDSQLKENCSNSEIDDLDPGGNRSEKKKSFTSDGNDHKEFMEKNENYNIRLTTSTIDFTNNSLANSLSGLSIRDSSDCIPTASVVQATTVKNISLNKESPNGDTCSSPSSPPPQDKNESIHKKTSKEIKSTLADESEYTIPPAIAEDVLREMLANKPSQDLLEELESTPVIINGKNENSSLKCKVDSVTHEKNA